ncbi:MAG: hypothetical protein V4488_22885, partial [Pseudomonadota bacterium]
MPIRTSSPFHSGEPASAILIPAMDQRRRLLLRSLGSGALALGAAPLLSGCSPGEISPAAFNSID